MAYYAQPRELALLDLGRAYRARVDRELFLVTDDSHDGDTVPCQGCPKAMLWGENFWVAPLGADGVNSNIFLCSGCYARAIRAKRNA